MAKEREAKKKVKRPTAEKRDIRNEKRRLINKAFKTRVRTTLRTFETALKQEDKGSLQTALQDVYSMMDRAVQRGLYKRNKAARIKARHAQKVAAL